MKKFLFSIMLSIVFLIPFTIQANTVSTPSYQVDKLSSVADIGSSKVLASNTVKAAETTRSLSQIKNIDLNIKMTAIKQKPKIILIGQCVSCHSTAAGTNGVSGGNSIGISKPS